MTVFDLVASVLENPADPLGAIAFTDESNPPSRFRVHDSSTPDAQRTMCSSERVRVFTLQEDSTSSHAFTTDLLHLPRTRLLLASSRLHWLMLRDAVHTTTTRCDCQCDARTALP